MDSEDRYNEVAYAMVCRKFPEYVSNNFNNNLSVSAPFCMTSLAGNIPLSPYNPESKINF